MYGCSSTTPQQWVQFSHHNITQAKEEMLASLHLRENIKITVAQVCSRNVQFSALPQSLETDYLASCKVYPTISNFVNRMKKTKSARSDLFKPHMCFSQVQNELESQRIATQFTSRKRAHQLEQAHQELQWQIKSVNYIIHLHILCVYLIFSLEGSVQCFLSDRLRMRSMS